MEQQDGVPLSGSRQQVNVSTRVTWQEMITPSTTPYPWYQQYPYNHIYYLPNNLFTVPDSGVVAVQIDIPENATYIMLGVSFRPVIDLKVIL